MPQYTYSWYGSPIHFVLEEEVAERYNRFMDCWFKAQKDHRVLHGKRWDPTTEPLLIDYDEKDKEVWDKIGNIINLLVEINGGGLDIPEEQMTSDYLVKVED